MRLERKDSEKRNRKWMRAQEYELRFHTQDPRYSMRIHEITQADIHNWRKRFKRNLSNHLDVDFSIFEGKDVIEIGCGSRGAVNLIQSPGRRVGIDPLVDSYRMNNCLLELKHVQLFSQMAENLDLPDASFDIAICFNVLDHCKNVQRVLEQIHRVLRPQGIFLLNVHTFERYSTNIFPWLLNLADPTHPNHFSKESIIRQLISRNFTLDVVDQQPLNLKYRNIFFRTAANFICKTLWVKAIKKSESIIDD